MEGRNEPIGGEFNDVKPLGRGVGYGKGEAMQRAFLNPIGRGRTGMARGRARGGANRSLEEVNLSVFNVGGSSVPIPDQKVVTFEGMDMDTRVHVQGMLLEQLKREAEQWQQEIYSLNNQGDQKRSELASARSSLYLREEELEDAADEYDRKSK